MDVKEVLTKFDELIMSKNLIFESIIIGGAALIVMDIVSRATKDIDCLDPDIPEEIKKLSIEFAHANPDLGLMDNWLNNGPSSLKYNLPEGWKLRLQSIYKGKALTLLTLGRSDLLKSKLFAYCDRQVDRDDCLAMNPTVNELDEALDWVAYQDGNEMWEDHVKKMFEKLKEKF